MENIEKNLSKYSDIPSPQNQKYENKYKLTDSKTETMYSTLYHSLSTKFNLSLTDSVILSTIVSLSKERMGGYCYMSQENLASLLRLTPQTINEKLQNFERIDLIEKAPTRSRYGTIQWRGTDRVRNYVKYLEVRIDEARKSKSGTKETLNNN